jgi:hypothetical protein
MADENSMIIETKESVALKMAIRISNAESGPSEEQGYRAYFLNLYAECLEAANGYRDFTK